jgi:hypothetical protein
VIEFKMTPFAVDFMIEQLEKRKTVIDRVNFARKVKRCFLGNDLGKLIKFLKLTRSA